MSRFNQTTRRALDERLRQVDQPALAPPPSGWLRTIRNALGMPTRQVAVRAGMSAAAVSRAERSETTGTIRLSTLRSVADALDCEVVYALVPRRGLETMIQEQARELAVVTVAAVARSMALEGQPVGDDATARQVAALAAKLEQSPTLWRAPVT